MEIIILILSVALAVAITLLVVFINKNKTEKSTIPQIPRQPLMQTVVQPKSDTTLNYKLQAYERITLLVERIYPPHLIIKLYNNNLKVREIQALAIETINKEYEHNITQQIYINHKIWQLLSQLKDNHIMSINIIADNYVGAKAAEFTKKIIETFDNEELKKPHALLLEAIQQEAKIILK